jgi:hypothetical protein
MQIERQVHLKPTAVRPAPQIPPYVRYAMSVARRTDARAARMRTKQEKAEGIRGAKCIEFPLQRPKCIKYLLLRLKYLPI